jgi:type IX secretion system PorP/SprF family membrane protein
MLRILWNKFVLFLFLSISSFSLNGQEIPIYYHSQYLLNPYLINPASIGSKDYSSINLSVRQISERIAGSPKTQLLSYNSRLKSPKGKRKPGTIFSNIGIGGYLFNNTSGVLHKTGFGLTYAYHIPLSKDYLQYISFGATFTGLLYSVNYSELNIIGDPLLYEGMQHAFVPDFNFGIYYYGKHLFGGISIIQILETPIKWQTNKLLKTRTYRRYFVQIGYKIVVTNNLLIEPSILYRETPHTVAIEFGWLHQFDINLKMYYKMFEAGVSYRTKLGISFWGIYKYQNFFFGLAYEYPTTGIWNYTLGNYNIVIGMNLGWGRNKLGDRRYW